MPHNERVLKFSRTDDEAKYILVNVKDRGPKPLDLRLEATEFEAEYASKLKQSDVSSLRAKNGPVDDGEWHTILEQLLRYGYIPDIEATAVVAEGKSISIIVRKSIQGISQRLGELVIPQIEGGELNVLEWCATAVDAVVDCEKRAAASTSKISQLENEVTELRSQVEELIQAKQEDETVLLMKFRDLLNEKKVKIREQQKVIAALPSSAGSASQQPSQPSQPTLPQRGRKTQTSRATKRKAAAPIVEEESDDGFESIEIDKVKTEPTEPQDPEETEKDTESDATASTASDGEPAPGPSGVPSGKAPKSQPLATGGSSAAAQQQKKSAQPPPKRSLPFTAKKPTPAVPGGEGSETASDDEL
ncbi:uncharacterized protein F5Z01DRAFT_316641 [Emericellopsis atlantica]|uniref:Uncharacterized protein n=1 Tax=Emericellopsis atlantica TaxID=2614577 RepID=A0A9P7ZUN1_9HYPO|nr:uncharacterized protein F5Z01DRAFT_316641 [Emericellopsis atlantica]KAG9258077.1 hypothetical protein F5Z01DRAFT_316641 [Emericellopsis atlantica]